MSGDERLFGTDGIRAPFGSFPLDEPTVTALGRELGRTLAAEAAAAGNEGATVVLGGDTRASTPTLCSWIARGLASEGVTARHVGVIPTAGVAALVHEIGAEAGVVVSASHNPYPDNGIKLLDGAGFKWSEEREAQIEETLLGALATAEPRSGDADRSGAQTDPLGPGESDLVDRYLDRLAASLDGEHPLDGLRIALDTGNGAASPVAGALFERLGARVRVLHDEPDGTNVNRGCGSTDTTDLARAVREGDAHLGAAFDGDADRVILVDRDGVERDGDAILYLWAASLDAAGALEPRAIVATSMSNLGLERALERRGIRTVRCGVGDRQVVETMRREGIVLGGEQSGHIVHLGLTTTGDGLLTALHVAALAAAELRSHGGDRPLTELLSDFRRYPQVLLNVAVERKPELRSIPEVARKIDRVEERLGDDGRLVLRYSGTEPLARVMIEGPEQQEIDHLANELAASIRGAIGAHREEAPA